MTVWSSDQRERRIPSISTTSMFISTVARNRRRALERGSRRSVEAAKQYKARGLMSDPAH